MISLNSVVENASSHGQSELQRVDYLDGWRGLAIAFVLVSHFYPIEGFNLGRFGVDVFFVLSGMLMSNILYVRRVPLATFYKRRFSRVFPVFFVFLSLVCLGSLLFGLSEEHKNYFYSLFFLRAYFPPEPYLWNTGLPIGHIWSLNVEEHCYLALSLLTLMPLFRQREQWPLLLLGGSSILLNYLYTAYPNIASLHSNLKTEIVANHLLVSAGYFLIKRRFGVRVPGWLPMLTFGLAAYCYDADAPFYAPWLLSPLLLAFTVNHLDALPGLVTDLLALKPLRLLGIWSYSIYLWQQLFYFYGKPVITGFPLAGLILICLSIGLGVMSFYWLENPVRRYLNNRW